MNMLGGQCCKDIKTIEDASSSSSKSSQANEPSPSFFTSSPIGRLMPIHRVFRKSSEPIFPEPQIFVDSFPTISSNEKSLAGTVVFRNSSSFDPHKEDFINCLRDWKDDYLFKLVEEYFDNSYKTMDFCAVADNYLKRARDSKFLIETVVQNLHDQPFQIESVNKLLRHIDAGNPFTEQFFHLFHLGYSELISVLEKLQHRRSKFDKKIKAMKKWRMVTTVLFGSAFVLAVVSSVVAAAVDAPPVITALIGALTVPISAIGKWGSSQWNKYMLVSKVQKELVSSMQAGASKTSRDMNKIWVLGGKLEVEIKNLVQNPVFALLDGGVDVKLVIDEIMKKLEMFNETIDALGELTHKCSQDTSKARTSIVRRVIRYTGE